MNIHTFEVSCALKGEDFYSIQQELKSRAPSKWKALENGMRYWGLADKGIVILMKRIKKKDYFAYNITYRISALRVMENGNFVGLFNTENYEELETEVNKVLDKTCIFLPHLKNCKLRRIDFCVNALLKNQEQVKAYIKTVKRGNIPPKMEEHKHNDKKAKRKKAGKNEFTVCAGEHVEVSIYNKYAEMRNQEDYDFPEKEIERAQNIVRIEIRCKKGKVKALMDKYHIKTISRFMERAEEIGDELYNYYLGKMFNKGYITTLKEALSWIEDSGYRKKTIEELKEFVTYCNEFRSAGKAFELFGKYKNVDNMVKQLDDIQTNYVTVTKSDVKMFDNGYIPTPLELYNEYVA